MATAGLLAGSASAFAQSSGVPSRECSAEDIRQAMAGEYSGPPCRFTNLPDGMDASSVPVAEPRLAGGPPPRTRAQAAVRSEAEYRSSSSFRTSTQHTSLSGSVPSQPAPQVRPAMAPAPLTPARPSGERVVLDEAFFASGLAGGVERPQVPLYSYRGIILIGADGRVQTAHAGLAHRTRIVRAMDAAQAGPRRAYPYN